MAIDKENLIKNIFTGILTLLLLISVLFLGKAWIEGHFKSIETLRDYLAGYGGWGPIILLLIQALQVVLPVLPGFLGCIVGAIMFGPERGFLINYIGISSGSIMAYWLARIYGKDLVRKLIPLEKYEKFERWVNRGNNYTLVLTLAVLLPLAPDDFLCYFSGLTAMSAKKFTAIILLAKPWDVLLYSFLFSFFI